MVIKPKIRGFICTNAHPTGCAESVRRQIQHVKQSTLPATGPKNVLVIGASTGYGLASRIVSAFGFQAKTLGIFFEKEGTEKKTGSAGWYNTAAFQQAADEAGLWSKNINGDAFSNEIKAKTIETIKAEMGKVDLVIYSLASPRRTDPTTGETYSSTLKPIGQSVTTKNLNTSKRIIDEVTVEAANEDEIANTVKVMGGEDWEMWIDALAKADVLADGVKTTAYTYIGKELTWPIYGGATIGKAKEDLDRASKVIDQKLKADLNGASYVSVLKALVTQSSSAIPVMPLYISALYKVMKEEGTHEGCIEQITGLMFEQLYGNGELNLDDSGRIRMEDNELKEEVQAKVSAIWEQVNSANLDELTDFKGYQQEFFKLFGFGLDGVDYEADVDPIV